MLLLVAEGLSSSLQKDSKTISTPVRDQLKKSGKTDVVFKEINTAGVSRSVIVNSITNYIDSCKNQKIAIVVVGKSWGGYEFTITFDKLIEKFKDKIELIERFAAVFVDSHGMNQSDHARTIKPEWRKIGKKTHFSCVYQRNSKPLGTCFNGADVLHELGKEDKVNGKQVDHFNIVFHEKVASSVLNAINWAAQS